MRASTMVKPLLSAMMGLRSSSSSQMAAQNHCDRSAIKRANRMRSIGGRPLTPARSFAASQLVQHGPCFVGFDRRQAQGHVVQDFRPHAAEAGHHDRPKERIVPSPEDQFGTRFYLPLQKSRAGA
jgi:hypothetical protein